MIGTQRVCYNVLLLWTKTASVCAKRLPPMAPVLLANMCVCVCVRAIVVQFCARPMDGCMDA
jgi:hypothetical protein